jgi:carboxymethylenebutenolidase
MKMPRFALSVLLPLTLLAACSGPSEEAAHVDRMEQEHAGDEPVASPATESESGAEIETRAVAYADLEGTPITGYLARPAGEGPHPGLIVIQEWWGLNDNIRAMAERFAAEGYVALAVDLYEGEVAGDRETAATLMRASLEKTPRLEENLRQAARYLLEQEGVHKIGTIGWCFGGGWSLRTALLIPDEISASTIYYGRVLTDPAELEPLQAPILGIFGALDQGIPVESVREFEAALESLGKPAAIHVYENADHAFANPSGTRYNEEAATDAWEKTLAFFAENLS